MLQHQCRLGNKTTKTQLLLMFAARLLKHVWCCGTKSRATSRSCSRRSCHSLRQLDCITQQQPSLGNALKDATIKLFYQQQPVVSVWNGPQRSSFLLLFLYLPVSCFLLWCCCHSSSSSSSSDGGGSSISREG